MLKGIPLLIVLLQAGVSLAQTGPADSAYVALVERAFSALNNNECEPCIRHYKAAFVLSKHSVLSHLRAAICAEKCGKGADRDLFISTAADIDWSLCLNLLEDNRFPEITAIKNTPLASKMAAVARQRAESLGVDFELMAELEDIEYEDQKYRLMIDSVLYEHGEESPEYRQFVRQWMSNDSNCLARIENIIATHGYPGKPMVG